MPEERPPWFKRFGGISGTEPKDAIPVPPGGTFQGRKPPRTRLTFDEGEEGSLEERWSAQSRCDRTAEVTEVSWLTRTGTLRLGFEVTDGRPFAHVPGNFVRIERHVPDKGYRRGTYCILSPPSEYHRFDLLIRVIPDGRMSQHLASLRLGAEVAFRGPTGRSMLRYCVEDATIDRSAGDRDLVLVATGVGVAPLYSLCATLLRSGDPRRIDLFWGLRLAEDICLTQELDRLADAHDNFRYHITLSQPPDGWEGLRGRVTESLPGAVGDIAGRRFFLSGNGAMIEEMAAALAEVGVERDFVYEEPYFNPRHVPDPHVVAAIVDRFQ